MSSKLVFKKSESSRKNAPGEFWKILIVDDSPEVHEATTFVLKGEIVLGKGLFFIHAYSGAECLDALKEHPDTAVVLMDAVMETRDAGLQAVKKIRENLGMGDVRIILRTGQPGDAPEVDSIHQYDINDYKTKNELTRNRLLTSIITAVRSYSQLKTIEAGSRSLRRIIETTRTLRPDVKLDTLAAEILKRFSSLFGFNEMMIFCRSHLVDDDAEIIAWMDGDEAGQGDEGIQIDSSLLEQVRLSLGIKKSAYGENSISIFFDDSEEFSYAVGIQTGTYREEEIPLIEVFASNLSLAVQNFLHFQRMSLLAYEDPALKIPNLSALINKIESLDSTSEHILFLLDINQFGSLNDMLGHDYGDLVLSAVVRRLKESLQSDSYIARVAGDVFSIISRNLNDSDLLDFFTKPVDVEEGKQKISVSIGSVILSRGCQSGSDCLKNAHIALKRSKSEGMGSSVRYNPEIGLETRERIRLLHDLRAAFTHEKLFLMYQPQVDIETGKPIGFEALLRWKTSEGNFIPPSTFIPVAEQGGLIVPMGTWIMRMAMHALRDLNRGGYRDIHMAINVSAIQLSSHDFLPELKKALKDSGVAPEKVDLEITESAAILGAEKVLALFREIKALGLTISIDDFGTGYSSLSSIDSWPADRLKIDRSFVKDLVPGGRGGRIVDLVIPLGKKLGMKVLAEGIETDEQARILLDLGCPEGQGYLYGKPMVLSEARNWLKERS